MGENGEPVGPQQLDRRQALKRAAAVGGALWVVPAVQSINMSRAFAASLTNVCSNFRIQNGGDEEDDDDDGRAPGLGGKCFSVRGIRCPEMPYTDPSSCAPINTGRPTPISTPEGADWVICLDAGCEVEGVGLKQGNQCLYSPQNPMHHNQGLPVVKGDRRWGASSVTWYVDANNCLHVTRLEKQSPRGFWRLTDISHLDVISCCPGP
jgi:hypothetical protein